MALFGSKGKWLYRGETFFDTNFSEYDVGENPYDWVNAPIPGDFLVQNVSGSISGKALVRPDASGSLFDAVYFFLRAAPGYNFEVLTSVRTSTLYTGVTRRLFSILLRRYENPGLGASHVQYVLYLSSASVGLSHQFFYTVEGSGSTGPFSPTQISGSYAGEWVWCRLRLVGQSFSARVWKRGQTEPTSWFSVTVSSDINKEGVIALFNGSPNAAELQMDYFAVEVAPEGATPSTIPLPI